MYKIKQLPEDFYVEEVMKLELGEGDYSYFLLEKKKWNTLDLVEVIAKKLGIKVNRIGYAGIKDRNAVSRQYISIFKINKERVENLKIKNARLNCLGNGRERIFLGRLKGNKFRIAVRDLDKTSEKKIKNVVNYFDEQRFSGRNILIGRALVKREFSKVVKMLGLKIEGRDYIGTLRGYGGRKLKFFVDSYQSYLFNEAVSEYLRSKYKNYKEVRYSLGEFIFVDIKNFKFPVVGYLTEFKNKEIEEIYLKLFEKEEINLKDFLVREFNEISSEGVERDLSVEVKNFKFKSEKDELFKGKFKDILEFELGKGSYATIVIKNLY